MENIYETDIRESDSCSPKEEDHDRPSTILQDQEEGSINDIKPTINAGGKYFAEAANNFPAADRS